MTEMSRVAFVGGFVWTDGYATPRALDVLIEDNLIVDIAAPGGLDTSCADVRDITGRLLVPGFQDAHIHLGVGGADLLTCDLSGLADEEEVFAAIKKYADAHPELSWVVGGGWDRGVFPMPQGPSRLDLDRLVGGRPAFFRPFDRHGAWVSSAALAAAGVDRDTPDPTGGLFVRDPDGQPRGLAEETAIDLITAIMPTPTIEELKAALLAGQEYVLAQGITSVQDAIVGTGLGLIDHLDAYCALAEERRLRIRLTAALWWDPARGLEQISEIEERRARLEAAGDSGRVRADMVKIMVDGSGVLFMDAAAIREATVALDARGFAVHYHCYGDAATACALDAVAAAIAENGPGERRHHIAHLFVVAEDDFARFDALGVTANIQGFWAGSGVLHEHLGQSTRTDHPELLENPFGRLHSAGARLAGGSDWPVTTADPLACSRTAGGSFADPEYRQAIPDEDKLDLVAMFRAYTTGSAHVNGRSGDTGRIARGYQADLTIIDRDVFASDDALASGVVDEVWIAGRHEYTRVTARDCPAL